MDDAAALAAARAFGTATGPLRPVRAGPAPLYDVALADGRRVALRLHDPATDPRAVHDGLRLAEALADGGLATPWPQRTRDGALTVTVAGTTASALQWVAASPLAGGHPDPARLPAIGALLADLHLTAAAGAPPDLHLPDRRPTVPAHMSDDPVSGAAALRARRILAGLADAAVGPVLDDPGAVLTGPDGLWLIGTDRAGRGWRAQDLAAALWPHVDAPDLPTRRDALVAGYTAGGGDTHDAAPDRIALCLLLRAMHAAVTAQGDARLRARIAALADSLPG